MTPEHHIKAEPDVELPSHDFVNRFAYAPQARETSQPYQIKPEPESPAKCAQPEHAYRRSTRVRQVTVKQELLGSSTTLSVGQVKREAVKRVKAKAKRGYAPPEQYAHLQLLPEFLKEDLDSKSYIGEE